MQISLRSQMIAGTTALVGAAAIAMTPIAPSVSLPALSASKAAVALASVNNPLAALADTAGMAVDYLINNDYSDAGAVNWGAASGISDYTNSVLPFSYWNDLSGYLPAITNVGLIPNFLSVPFPVATQVLSNVIGYANTAFQVGTQVVGDLTSLLWAPVGVTIAVVQAVISGQISAIPTIIQTAIQDAVATVQDAVQITVAGANYIVQSVIARATAAVQVLAAAIPDALADIPRQIGVVAASAQTAITNIVTAASAGDVAGAWNAAVAGLLSPTGVPGTILNLTLGAGVQTGDVVDSTSYYANVVPSVRNDAQTLGQALSIALTTQPAVTSPVAAVRPAAAAKTVAATAADGAEAAAKKAPAKVGRHAAAARAAAAK